VKNSSLPEIKNAFVRQWLAYTDGSESPEIFNLWTGLSAVAACLGRRSSLNAGRYIYYPNMYVILTGPAAVRKSSTAGIAKDLLKQFTSVKFGPTDTAGKKQGLISAFLDAYGTKPQSASKIVNDILAGAIADAAIVGDTLTPVVGNDEFANVFATMRKENPDAAIGVKKNLNDRKRAANKIDHDLFIMADELSDFIGMNQPEMIGCLTSLYYPSEEYSYKLAESSKTIYRPGLNILACTTPSSLMKFMPETAIGQGFSSRTVFVYAGQSREKVFRPDPLNKELTAALGKHLQYLSSWSNEFFCTEEALELQQKIYLNYRIDLKDTRFTQYEQRRDGHLSKLMMCLAAGRGAAIITYDDVLDAHIILKETEREMHLSLGELGLNKITLAKQHIREMIEASWPAGVTYATLARNAARDMTTQQFSETINELVSRGICFVSNIKTNGSDYQLIIPKIQNKDLETGESKLERTRIEKTILAN
jgi:hypothetical protein